MTECNRLKPLKIFRFLFSAGNELQCFFGLTSYKHLAD